MLISIGPDKASKVTEIVREKRPKVVVELGGYLGYSGILFAHALSQKSSTKEFHVWSLEFEPEFAKIAEEVISIAGLSDCITVVTGSAEKSVHRLKAEGKVEHIDFLFLDHDEALYQSDLQVCEDLGLLGKGAMVVADNVIRPGAPVYRAYVRECGRYESCGVRGLIMPGEFEVSCIC